MDQKLIVRGPERSPKKQLVVFDYQDSSHIRVDWIPGGRRAFVMPIRKVISALISLFSQDSCQPKELSCDHLLVRLDGRESALIYDRFSELPSDRECLHPLLGDLSQLRRLGKFCDSGIAAPHPTFAIRSWHHKCTTVGQKLKKEAKK